MKKNPTCTNPLNKLHDAAFGGHLPVVKTLLANDSIDPNALVADTNKHGCAGMSALHLAAINGHLSVVKTLLANDSIDPSSCS